MIPILITAAVALGAGLAAGAAVYTRQERRRARQAYQEHLEQALADGILHPEEIQALEALRAEKELSDREVRMVALAIYRRALRDAAADSRITEEDDLRLRRLQQQLRLSDAELEADQLQVQRLRLLARADRGQLPVLKAPLALASGETCHWVVQAALCELLSLPTTPPEPPASLAIRVDKDDVLDTEQPRGALGADPSLLPSDLGMLVITSRRVIFRGAKRRLDLPHVRLRKLGVYRDGLRLQVENGLDARYFLVDDPELTANILLSAARHRQTELGGTVPKRSA
ncbi:MAG: hypothetical protein HY703_11595 [Gemmatimonadetes bacterium]|nr:hypothetical protein [Gemmatimonadota bacterium]